MASLLFVDDIVLHLTSNEDNEDQHHRVRNHNYFLDKMRLSKAIFSMEIRDLGSHWCFLIRSVEVIHVLIWMPLAATLFAVVSCTLSGRRLRGRPRTCWRDYRCPSSGGARRWPVVAMNAPRLKSDPTQHHISGSLFFLFFSCTEPFLYCRSSTGDAF